MNRRDFAQLFKFPISIMSTVSAATGYLAFTHTLSWRLLPVSGAILILAFAACALNEAQEHKLDALMERTKRRPIPSGKISPVGAVILAGVLAAVALTSLWLMGGLLAAGLGALAVLSPRSLAPSSAPFLRPSAGCAPAACSMVLSSLSRSFC